MRRLRRSPLIPRAEPLSPVSRAGHSGLRRSLPTAVIQEEAAEEDALGQAHAVGSARRGLVKTGRPFQILHLQVFIHCPSSTDAHSHLYLNSNLSPVFTGAEPVIYFFYY